MHLIDILKQYYKEDLKNRYEINDIAQDNVTMLEEIAINRKFLLKGNEVDFERASKAIIDDFKKGRIGKIILEKPNV